MYTKIMASSKSRQQVLNFRSMFIMADLSSPSRGRQEKVLVAIKAYADGSFDMTPGFSKEGCRYRFEDSSGGIYEYRVEVRG